MNTDATPMLKKEDVSPRSTFHDTGKMTPGGTPFPEGLLSDTDTNSIYITVKNYYTGLSKKIHQDRSRDFSR